ncbi:MAG: fimbrillin family protein [Bacteroidales bacterium]|nr:fimbrillin family protein [Bacteroidales bacterium]
MKRIYTYTLCLTALLLSACFDNENRGLPSDVYISFDPVVTANTRSDGHAHLMKESFFVWAYTMPLGQHWSAEGSEEHLLMDKEIISLQNNEWLPSNTYYWPLQTALTVFAVAPTQLKTQFNNTQGICIEDVDATQGIVPLFTYPTEAHDMQHSHGCVALAFVRSFSKVSVSIRSYAHQDSSIVLKALYIDSVAYQGDFHSLPQPTWECNDERMKLSFFEGEMDITLNAQSLSSHMVMGQNIDRPLTAVIDIYDQNNQLIEANRTLSTKSLNTYWQAGRYYDYTLNINSGRLFFATEMVKQP